MKIKFAHCRNIDNQERITPNGGLTLAYILNDDHQVIGYAPAKCHNKDHFNKRIGRIKAEGRLKSPHYFVEVAPTEEKEFIQQAMDGYRKNFH